MTRLETSAAFLAASCIFIVIAGCHSRTETLARQGKTNTPPDSTHDADAARPVETPPQPASPPRKVEPTQKDAPSPPMEQDDEADAAFLESDPEILNDTGATQAAAETTLIEPVGGLDLVSVEPDLTDSDSDVTVAEEPALPAAKETETSGPPPMRVLLPTTAGVFVLGIEIQVDQTDLNAAFSERIDEILAAAQKDSKTPTWEMVFDHVRSDPQTFGSMPPPVGGQAKEMIRRYDRNRNGRPDPDELSRFLFRSSGFANAFRLYGTDRFRQVNRDASRLFEAIDLNGDGALDAEEASVVAESIFRLDRNADRGISLDEAVVPASARDSPWDRRRTHRRGSVAMDLEGYVDWNLVSYALGGAALKSPLEGTAVAMLDSDGNRSISRQEAESMSEMEPDLCLRLRFFSDEPGEPELQVVSVRPELESAVILEHSLGAVVATLPSLRLRLEARDLLTQPSMFPAEAFEMLDANDDGFLDPDEIPAQAADQISVERLDGDGDGKLTLAEIHRGQRRFDPIWAIQVRGRAAEFPDAWFAWLDRDDDRFLSEREITLAPSRLQAAFDFPLRPSALPDTFVVQFARGDPRQDEQTFAYSRISTPSPASMPRWAMEMDSNEDGEISRMEFLGTPRQFDHFDDNADGFLDDHEIIQGIREGRDD